MTIWPASTCSTWKVSCQLKHHLGPEAVYLVVPEEEASSRSERALCCCPVWWGIVKTKKKKEQACHPCVSWVSTPAQHHHDRWLLRRFLLPDRIPAKPQSSLPNPSLVIPHPSLRHPVDPKSCSHHHVSVGLRRFMLGCHAARPHVMPPHFSHHDPVPPPTPLHKGSCPIDGLSKEIWG